MKEGKRSGMIGSFLQRFKDMINVHIVEETEKQKKGEK